MSNIEQSPNYPTSNDSLTFESLSGSESLVSPKGELCRRQIFEKKPDNPMFDEVRKQNQQYINGLEQQVIQLAMKDPRKYMKHQAIGDSFMNCSYDLTVGIDDEGDNIKANQLLCTVRDYNMDDNELSLIELGLLNRVYGNNWRSLL